MKIRAGILINKYPKYIKKFAKFMKNVATRSLNLA